MKNKKNSDAAVNSDKMKAFEEFYRKYFDFVRDGVCVLGCKDAEKMEDVIQGTFYEALKHLEEVENMKELEFWLMRTAADRLAAYNRDDDR